MRTMTLLILLSAFACSQTVDSGELAGADGGAISCDDPNTVVCDSQCVDTEVDPTFCGSCDNACAEGQGCAAGSCVDLCDPGLINCGGECIDPNTNANFCGASGTCSVETNGEECGGNACSGGACVAQRYIGSLPVTTGRWNYGGTIGVPGAEEACRTLYATPTATVCTYAHMLDAQSKGELVNATDNLGNAVTSWYQIDPTQNNLQRQCTKTDGENLPWTYETADLGQGSKLIELNATAGTVSAVIDAPSANMVTNGCRTLRSVACCLP